MDPKLVGQKCTGRGVRSLICGPRPPIATPHAVAASVADTRARVCVCVRICT